MSNSFQNKKPTVRDVALQAGVSLATVDRVLNARAGVRQATREKVEKAVTALNYTRDVGASLLARGKTVRLQFILPGGDNPFMENLVQALKRLVPTRAGGRTSIDVTRVQALDPLALSSAIDALGPKTCDCLIIVATDDENVRRSIDQAILKGLAVLTLVSDNPASKRHQFIGIDNIAAGRTAASLMGRFCAQDAQIGLIAGSMALRDHRDRFIGFHDTVLEEFPGLELVGPVEGFDDAHETAKRTQELLTDFPKMSGIYSMGAGCAGVITALQLQGRTRGTRVIVHELTAHSIRGLNLGIIDVVLDQNPAAEVSRAVDLAQRLIAGSNISGEDKHIDIGVFLRDNLHSGLVSELKPGLF